MVGETQILALEDGLDALIDYRGKTPKKTDEGIPLITAKIVKSGRIETPNEFIAESDYEPWMTRGYPELGDVVLTTEAPLGEVGQINFLPVALAQRIVTLRGKKGVLDNDYLLYLLQTEEMQSQLVGRASGTTVIGIKQSELRKVEVQLPSVSAQRDVASTLKALDDRIDNLRQTNATLEAIAAALFKSWFVDFDGIAPEDMQESELGLIPKGWRTGTLGEIFEINPKRELKKGTIAPYLDMASVPTAGAIPDAPVMREFSSGTKFTNGDTLLARITPCLENGKTAFVNFLEKDQIGWGSTEFIVLNPKPPLPPFFGYILARRDDFRTHTIRAMSGTSGRQRVEVGQLKNFKIAIPDETTASMFSDVVEPVQKALFDNWAQSATLATLRDSLLPRLISGQLRAESTAGCPHE